MCTAVKFQEAGPTENSPPTAHVCTTPEVLNRLRLLKDAHEFTAHVRTTSASGGDRVTKSFRHFTRVHGRELRQN